jgi:N-acylneuraminate cytidylyltransferase
MSAAGFRAARHRFFGRTAVVQVPELTSIDIDHLHDLALAGALAQVMEPPQEIDVDAVITDFDGVHTDDSVIVAQDGRESVRVSRADGLGIERLRSIGIPLLIVSKEINPVVAARAAKLRVGVIQGVTDKRSVVRDWLAAHNIPLHRAAYLGNDVNDLGPMGLVGWPVAVADAHPSVRQAARLVLARPGGHGAVRELCDLLIEDRRRAAQAKDRTTDEGEATSERESSGEGVDVLASTGRFSGKGVEATVRLPAAQAAGRAVPTSCCPRPDGSSWLRATDDLAERVGLC